MLLLWMIPFNDITPLHQPILLLVNEIDDGVMEAIGSTILKENGGRENNGYVVGIAILNVGNDEIEYVDLVTLGAI